MKIKKIEALPFDLKLKEPFIISNVKNYIMKYVVVRIITDDGIEGYGEAIPAWEVTGETQDSVVGLISLLSDESLLGFSLIGKDISSKDNIIKLLDVLNASDRPSLIWGNPSGKAALEQAMLDALGKKINQPIYQLFGKKNHPVLFNHVISFHDVDETLDRVKNILKSSSPKTIKLKIGLKEFRDYDNYERDVLVIRKARELVDQISPETLLVADANQGLIDATTTIDFCKKVQGCLDWLEQPVLAEDKLAFLDIKKAVDVPLMADESIHNPFDAKLLLELGCVDYINVKLMKCGGMLEALKIASLAAQYGVKCQVGSMIENTLGLSMGIHTYLCHDNFINTELCTSMLLEKNLGEGVKFDENHVSISDKPGCGISLSQDDLKLLF